MVNTSGVVLVAPRGPGITCILKSVSLGVLSSGQCTTLCDQGLIERLGFLNGPTVGSVVAGGEDATHPWFRNEANQA